MKTFQLFLLLAAFPTLIFGIQCAVGGICYNKKETGLLVDVPIKTCKDACVYFKCSDGYDIKEGVGCYEDFINVCKYIPTKYKEEIQSNSKQYSITNEDLIYIACSDKDGCATNGLKHWTSDNVEFNIGPNYHSYNNTCNYVERDELSYRPNNTKCYRELQCQPGKLYFTKGMNYMLEGNSKWFNIKNEVRGGSKECDGCFYFKCSNDGGNTVITGKGCFDDFEYACPSVPNDFKEKMKENAKDSFYFGENYMVTSCSSKELPCNLFYYERYNSLAQKALNVNTTFDKICHIDFADPPTTLPPHNFSHGQENAFKINGIITVFFVLVFIRFL